MIPLTIECKVHFQRRGSGSRKELRQGSEPRDQVDPGRVPRVARLMALAIRFDSLLRKNVIDSYADLATLGHVSRPRISQIMNLLQLAPDIQEEILFLSRIINGRDRLQLRQLQPIAARLDWRKQRKLWNDIKRNLCLN